MPFDAKNPALKNPTTRKGEFREVARDKVFLEPTAKGAATWLKAIDDGHVRQERK
jgi:hypothetical protein